MALINFARKEVEAKVVYYGPAFSGKTTNVQVLHGLVPDAQRGSLNILATEEDRTLFFDYVPVSIGQIAGFSAKFKLFTVPGQVFYKETRRIVLQGADAVVFVADSSPDRADANIDSLIDLEENLRSHGLDLSSIPLVIQLNKRDVPGARGQAEMVTDLNPFGVPIVEAVSSKGTGVMETLKAVTDIAAARIRDNLAGRQTAVALTAVERPEVEDERKVIRDHLEKIKRVRPMEEERGERLTAEGLVRAAEIDAFLLQNVERADQILAEKGKRAARPTPPPPPPPPKAPETHQVTARPAAPAAAPPAAAPPVALPPASDIAPSPRSPAKAMPPPPPVKGQMGGFVRPEHPMGAAFEAVLDQAQYGAPVVKEVVRTEIGADGLVRVELLLVRGKELSRHLVSLVPRPRPAEPVRPEAPAPETNWLSVAMAGLGGIGLGLLFGLVVGWIAFS
jgi:signal recognition particle receptor subunit beta